MKTEEIEQERAKIATIGFSVSEKEGSGG